MTKISFPRDFESYGEVIRPRFIKPEYPVDEDLAGNVSNLVSELGGVDYAAAGLDEKLPINYANTNLAIDRFVSLQASERCRSPLASYVLCLQIGDTFQHATLNSVGMATYLRGGAQTPIERIKHRFVDNGVRQMVGWFNINYLSGVIDAPVFAERTILTGLDLAREAGLRRLEIERIDEAPQKDPRLIVVEHEIDPQMFGFSYDGRVERTFEGVIYEGELWSQPLDY